jgi:hypothetical protein
MISTRTMLWLLVTAASHAACASTELEVPTNHAGHPRAQTAPILRSSALNADLDVQAGSELDASAPAQSPHAGHAPGAHTAPAQEARPPEVSPTHVVYTCPMHEEVRQQGPGKCPICGMKLVPVKDRK